MEICCLVLFYIFMVGVCFKFLTVYFDDEDAGYIFPSLLWIIVLPGFLGYLAADYIHKNILK